METIEIKNPTGETSCFVKYNSTLNYPYFEWHGFVDTPELKKACEAMLDAVKNTKAVYYASDNRKATGFSDELVPYTGTIFNPAIKALGVTHHAMVFTPEVFAQMAVEEFEKGLVGMFKAKMVQSLEEGEAWYKAN